MKCKAKNLMIFLYFDVFSVKGVSPIVELKEGSKTSELITKQNNEISIKSMYRKPEEHKQSSGKDRRGNRYNLLTRESFPIWEEGEFVIQYTLAKAGDKGGHSFYKP